MSAPFFVNQAECRLVISPKDYPKVEIAIEGYCPKVAICADSVRIAEFEKSVEAFVRQELPKFVKLEGQA